MIIFFHFMSQFNLLSKKSNLRLEFNDTVFLFVSKKEVMHCYSGDGGHVYFVKYTLNLCFFEPTWLFYLKFNLSKTTYFLKRTWFLYILSKYHGMFKFLQWNARLWKKNTYCKNSCFPRKFSIYRSCIKSSIEVLKYN